MKISIEDISQSEAEDLFGAKVQIDNLHYKIDRLELELSQANARLETSKIQAAIPAELRNNPAAWSKLASAFADAQNQRKINAIKTIRELLGCGLKEAKDIVEGTFYRYP